MTDTKKIITFNGEEALRSNCRYISGKFYIKDKHCFLMEDGKWHRINNGLLEFDHDIQRWILKNSMTKLENGIVDFDENGKFIFGYFTYNNIKNVIIKNAHYEYLCLSEHIIPKNLFTERLSNGIFYEKEMLIPSLNRKGIKGNYNFKLYYIYEHLYNIFKDIYDKFFTFIPDKTKSFYKELNGTTYGTEIESWDGQIPERFCLKSGLIPLKDGSLRHGDIQPFEYTSIPLEGEKGLHTIKEYSRLLNKYCEKSLDCSVHVHIGNFGRSEDYIISLYRTILAIQNDLYDLFPPYTSKTSEFKASGKDYCSPLDKLELSSDNSKNLKLLFEYYITGYKGEIVVNEEEIIDKSKESLWEKPIDQKEEKIKPLEEKLEILLISNFSNFLTESSDYIHKDIFKSPKKIYKNRLYTDTTAYYIGMEHPNDPSDGDRKWDIQTRYKNVNLIPLLFGRRGTTEFRLHTSTFNSDKIINWIFICNGICKYAFENKEIISREGSSIYLNELIKSVYSEELSNYLISYMNYRKELMIYNLKKGDHSGTLDIANDTDFSKWNYPFKSLI
jgi:hypothetical protein